MSASLLLQIAVKVSILLAMAWLTTRAMRRSSASARHFVWTIAILAVLFVPVIVLVGPAWQLRVLPDLTAPAAPPLPAEQLEAMLPDSGADDRVRSVSPVDPLTGSRHSGRTVGAVGPSTDSAAALIGVEASTSESQASMNWQPWLLGLWAAGVTFVLLRLGIGIVWVCWTARRAEPITDAAWLSILEEVTTTLQFKGGVSLRRSDRTTIPVACGIWRPSLLMPLDADDWSADRRRVVLLHELAHVKRRDCRLQAIAQVAYAWHWFNPLVHVAVARLRAEQERACDDLVLAAGTDGPAYADHLFEIARAFRSDALPRWAMLAMAGPSQLEGRVLAILDADQRRHVPSRRRRAVIAVLVAAAVVTLGAFRLVAASNATVTSPEQVIESSTIADNTEDTDIDVDFDSASIATATVPIISPVDSTLPDQPQLAAQGPGSRFNPWLDGLIDPQFDFVPPVDIQVDVDPNPDPNPDFDFHFDFNFDPPVLGLFGAPGTQAPADAVPDETRRRVADALSSAINDENPRVREQAIQGLANMRDPRAVPALVKALQSRDVRLRRIAVNSLGQFDTPEAAQGLVGALKDENPDVRRVAISALARRRDDKYADAIVGAMKDQNADVRRQAVAALARSGQSAAVVGALVQALKDPSADVRERAAGSLARVGSAEAVPALMAALKDANTEVRQMAAVALGSIADPRAIDALTAALKDTDPEVREHAARALSRIARGQRRGPGRFPVAHHDDKELEREFAKVQKVEFAKIQKQMAKVHEDLEKTKVTPWWFGSLDPREMVDAAMRQADQAFKQSEESWRQLEQGKGWTEPETGR